MAYFDNFQLADEVAAHFDEVVAAADPLLRSRYAGFFAVASAAVLEVALKQIVIEYAAANHELFGSYVAARYERINGRIAIDDCHKEHLKPFGERYQKCFKRRLEGIERYFMQRQGLSVKASYNNLLTWRHSFAHQGAVPSTATYEEVKQGFEAGKLVMQALARTLTVRGRTSS